MNTQARNLWLALNYAATIFVSAFLLFQLQPLVSKHILPWFGGSPAVWTTAMLFFQTVLLAGYAYAHCSRQWFSAAGQGTAHLVLILAAVGVVSLRGILPDASWEPHDSGSPIGQILLMLAATVGLPYFVLSSTAPLVQTWFAGSFPGRSPYRLYALSNFGSLLALLSYPIVCERFWDLPQQAWFWAAAFGVFAALCGIAAAVVWRLHADVQTATDDVAVASPRWWQRALWVVLPALASVALLATTNHVCSDVAVIPLLWVVPLALYLVTFIVAFDHPRWYRPALVAGLTLAVIYVVAAVYWSPSEGVAVYDCGTLGKWYRYAVETIAAGLGQPLPASPQVDVGFVADLLLNFVAMFGISLMCHGEVYRQRPDPRHLTGFYLSIAAGGALGGAAVSLVAPRVFNTYLEWDLSLYAGAAVAMTVLLRTWVAWAIGGGDRASRRRRLVWAIGGPIALAVLVMTDLSGYFELGNESVRLRSRNFFGRLTIRERNADDADAAAYVLQHGTITHGMQFRKPSRHREATTYYSEQSGVGLAIAHYRGLAGESGLRIGAVGLGTGTLATYASKGDTMCFYEINPAVIELAESGQWFTFLPDCQERGAQYEIKLGDARLTLERELREGQPRQYDVLVLDAFSGDAIPTHLLTEQAFGVYLEHLATPERGGRHGAIAVHISNRYLDLEPVVRGAAERWQLHRARVRTEGVPAKGISASDWLVLSRDESLVNDLAPDATAPGEHPRPAITWTDSRSNLFEVLQ